MNQKLTIEDREAIRGMLRRGLAHSEIADAFGVCTRTIDREAERLAANIVTIRIRQREDGAIAYVRTGRGVQNVDMTGLMAEAERIAAELGQLDLTEVIAAAEKAVEEAEASLSSRDPAM